jgi:hypothetical protein
VSASFIDWLADVPVGALLALIGAMHAFPRRLGGDDKGGLR